MDTGGSARTARGDANLFMASNFDSRLYTSEPRCQAFFGSQSTLKNSLCDMNENILIVADESPPSFDHLAELERRAARRRNLFRSSFA